MSNKPNHRFSIPCFNCETPAFLIRGFCRSCRPDLHSEFESQREVQQRIEAAYEAETGKTALANWSAFELWCNEKLSLLRKSGG